MSVLAPPPLYTRENTNLLAPLGDGWEWTTKVSCRPWRALVFNIRLSDFCATPDSLADLAFADQFGLPIPNAGDLGALLGLLVTLPGEVKAKPGRNGFNFLTHTQGWLRRQVRNVMTLVCISENEEQSQAKTRPKQF